MATNAQDQALRVEAHYLLGLSALWPGDFVRAIEHTEQSVACYDAKQHHSHSAAYGQVSAVHSLCCCGLAFWEMGYPDKAQTRTANSVLLAQEAAVPYSVAAALNVSAVVHQLRREGQETLRLAEAAVVLSVEHGFPYWIALGTHLRGWALFDQGHEEEGLALMRQGITALRETGSELLVPHMLTTLAEAYGKRREPAEGLILLTEASEMVAKNEEHLGEPELYRLKGELTLQQAKQKAKSKSQKSENLDPNSQILDPQGEAEACFLKAIEIAQRQQAKSLELRATMSLARLWQQQGKRTEAHKLLSDVYNWFTEGFETKDLQEAKALLDTLSR